MAVAEYARIHDIPYSTMIAHRQKAIRKAVPILPVEAMGFVRVESEMQESMTAETSALLSIGSAALGGLGRIRK